MKTYDEFLTWATEEHYKEWINSYDFNSGDVAWASLGYEVINTAASTKRSRHTLLNSTALREQQEAEAREAYPNLLMDALERATRLGFKLVVQDQKFVVVDSNSPSDSVALTYSYTPDADSDLDMLRWELEQREAAEAEANRKWLARQAALAKLSDYERELLGL